MRITKDFFVVFPYVGRLGFPHPGGDNPLPLNGTYGNLSTQESAKMTKWAITN